MIDRRWAVPVALILYGSVTYYIGKNTGRFEEKDAQAKAKITQSDKHTDSVQIRTDTSKRQVAKLDSTHDIVRRRVKMVHDTILLPAAINQGKDSIIVVSPEIAALIQSDDSLIAAQKRTLALDDTLIASLRVGIRLRDQRISILEKAVLPSKASRFIAATKYIAIGAIIGVAFQHR